MPNVKTLFWLTAELIEKQRRVSDFLIVSLITIVYIKIKKSSCEKNFANRTKFSDHVRLFQKSFLVFMPTFQLKGVLTII